MDIGSILFLGGVIILYVAMIAHIFIQREKIKDQIIKMVEQAGGRKINVEYESMWWNRGAFYFTVTYIDTSNSSYRTHRVSSKLNSWGLPTGDLFWDKPLLVSEPSTSDNARLASKEQIISDMDAEIKRLQEELTRVKKEAE